MFEFGGNEFSNSEPRSGASGVLGAWERLERARTRLRSGAWALYALPPSESAPGVLADGPTLYSDDSAPLDPVPGAGASDFDPAPLAPAKVELAPSQSERAPTAASPSAYSKTSHREES